MSTVNSKGHAVRVGESILAYHVERMLTALGFADVFASTLAIEHARLAAHEARIAGAM